MASLIRVAATLVALSVSAPAFAELEWFNYNVSGSSFGGAPWQRTGWVPGYVIIRSGERFEGNIRKLKVNGSLAEIHIRIVDGKKKRTLELPLESLRQYGPHVTIEYLTKGGKRLKRDPAKNFHPGSVTLIDGSRAEGWVAVLPVEVRFTPDKDAHVTRYEPADLLEAAQSINGKPAEWISYSNEMQARPDAGDLATRQGSIELLDGRELTGQVALLFGDRYATAVNFVGADQRVERIGANRIKLVTLDNAAQDAYVNFGGLLTKVLADGDAYMLFRNPFPTTENKFLSGLANAAIGTIAVVGTAAVAQAAQKAAVKNAFEQTMEETNDTGAAVNAAMVAGHQIQQDQMAALSQYERDHDWDPVKIYKTEFVIFNKQTGEAVAVNKSNFDDKSKGALMGCGRFLMMSKRDQKGMLKFKELDKMVDFLNSCYQR